MACMPLLVCILPFPMTAIPPHACSLPLSSFTALNAACSLLRAFWAGGSGPEQMRSPGNPTSAFNYDYDMLCTHLHMGTLAQSHQHSQVTGRVSSSQVRTSRSSSSMHSLGASGAINSLLGPGWMGHQQAFIQGLLGVGSVSGYWGNKDKSDLLCLQGAYNTVGS